MMGSNGLIRQMFSQQCLKFGHHLRRSWSILVWFPTGIFLTNSFYSIKYISGRSMQPTLNPDSSLWRDIALFEHFSTQSSHKYQRDDIVTLRSPVDARHILVKRIVALEGDIVQTRPPYPDIKVCVPQGHVWVEGDESFRTEDSNTFGPVPMALVESRLTLILWPLNRFGHISKPHLFSSKTGALYRQEKAQLEKERTRHARVKVADT